MSDSPTPRRTRFAAAGAALGASAVAALVLGVGPAPSVLQLAGASRDDVADDISGNCDEAEHAADPECAGTPVGESTSTTGGGTSTTTGGGAPITDVRSIDAAGAGTVIVAVEDGSLRLVSATPTSGWRVEIEQSAGREVELDFRSGTRRVQVNVGIEDGQVRERVRVRDDADGTDVGTEDGVVVRDDSDDRSSRGPGSGGDDHDDADDDDDRRASGHSSDDDGHSGSGHSTDDD